jgi:hypothetical protein
MGTLLDAEFGSEVGDGKIKAEEPKAKGGKALDAKGRKARQAAVVEENKNEGGRKGDDEDAGEESADERLERLQQGEGEDDEEYEARLEEEGLTREDVEALDEEDDDDGDDEEGDDELAGDNAELLKELRALRKKVDGLESRRDSGEGGDNDFRGGGSIRAGRFGEAILQAGSPRDLDAVEERLQQVEDWALDNEGGVVEEKDGEEVVKYSKAQVRGVLRDARAGLRAVEGRRSFFASQARMDADAVKAYPDLGDEDSGLARGVEAVLRARPALAREVPDIRLFLADAIAGRRARLAAAKGGKRIGKPSVRQGAIGQKPPSGGARAGRGRMADDKRSRIGAARKRAEADGGASLEDLIAAEL